MDFALTVTVCFLVLTGTTVLIDRREHKVLGVEMFLIPVDEDTPPLGRLIRHLEDAP